ncbi:MAG: metallophosphoesterase family protein [SAR202 cluster bacterium]|nr:metallophosphoesterase family protein [SAR202 cluster bacterium]
MRALIVSDVHSNLEALESVVEDAKNHGGFDEIWSLGDLVGYGPDPSACIALLRLHEVRAVAGNHDLAAFGRLSLESFNDYAAAAARWTAEKISTEDADWLASLPLRIEVEDFTMVHGSPRDPVWEYVVSVPVAAVSFQHFTTTRCLVGHSHVPFLCVTGQDGPKFLEFRLDDPVPLGNERMIVNPGGVGQPRDGDPRTSYVVYDSDDGTVAHFRAEYDIKTTQDKMEEYGLPKYLADRLSEGR